MNFKKYLEAQLEETPAPTIKEQIKAICKGQLDKSCGISEQKKNNMLTVTIKKFITDGDIRSIIPSIEAINGIEKVETWSVPEDDNLDAPSKIIINLAE